MPAYPQTNAVGVTPRAATTLQAVANATGLSKQEIVSQLIEEQLEPAVALGAGLVGFLNTNRS
jgi:hypothetical protein